MRVSSSQYHLAVSAALQQANKHLEKVTTQIATGKKLTLPSDDPNAHVRQSRLEREEASIAQYRSNLSALQSRLGRSEALLSGLSQDLLQVHEMLVAAANGTNTPEDLDAMAASLVSLRDSLFFKSNSRDQEGHFVFSGTLSGTQTIAHDERAAAGRRYTFQGNTEQQRVVIGDGVTQFGNLSLEEAADILNRIDTAIEAMRMPDDAANAAQLRQVLASALEGSDTAIKAVSLKIARLGGAQNILASLDSDHANASLANRQALAEVGQLDYSEAVMRLKSLTSAIEATQKAYGRVNSLSLFDVL